MTFPWLLRFDMPHIVDFHWVPFLTLLTSVDAHFCSSPGSFLLLRSQLQHRLMLVQFPSFAISPSSSVVSCIHFDSLGYCSLVPSFVLYLVSVPLAAALSPARAHFCSLWAALSHATSVVVCVNICSLGCSSLTWSSVFLEVFSTTSPILFWAYQLKKFQAALNYRHFLFLKL